MIGEPSRDVSRILGQQHQLPGLEIEAVDIEDLPLAPVETDNHLIVEMLAIIDDLGAYAIERREVDEVTAVGVDRHDVQFSSPLTSLI